jgi:hypothetical protein
MPLSIPNPSSLRVCIRTERTLAHSLLVCQCRDLGGEEAVGSWDNGPADSGGDGPRRRADPQAELRRHQRRGRRQLGGGHERRQDEPHLAHRQLHPQAQELPL